LIQTDKFIVSNGRIVLQLESAAEGGYVVTSPFDPALITQAETMEEAFANAADAAKILKVVRSSKPKKRVLAGR
jgi:antitoxin HicB